MRAISATLALALAAAACAPSTQAGAPAPGANAQATPCAVSLRGAPLAGWKQVQGEGFTYCVPGEWRAQGARGWRGDGGSVEWGWGDAVHSVRTATTTTTVRTGEGMPSAEEQLSSQIQNRTFTETVGGREASFYVTEVSGQTFHTGVVWTEPRKFHLQGEARSRATADRQLDVYRTVRFTGS